jgi:23S rRNA (adenine2503-C2)-methyltransferase
VLGIKGLSLGELATALAERGAPRYRTGQIVQWIYAKGVHSFDEMTNLPAALRLQLEGDFALPVPRIALRQVSNLDDTRKYLFELADGEHVEAVGLPANDRLTVCFSTQAGCAMGCSFCATGAAGFVRDLAPGEMVDQVRLVAEDYGRRASNAVAMGQGEPFANYDAVLAGMRFMNDSDALGIGARHLTVSTCGLVSGIRRLAEEPEQFTLAVSLHSAVQATRDRIMPGVRGISLSQLRAALGEYSEKTGRRPSLEYALLEGVNDTDRELAALIQFARGMLAHVNLIGANPVDGLPFRRSSAQRARAFETALSAAGIETSLRAERGADIDAACGQLRQRGPESGEA